MGELAQIYVGRGVEPALARQVAEQLMVKDALAAHARDDLAISEVIAAKSIQAGFISAATFAIGAALPIASVFFTPRHFLVPVVSGASLVFLALGAFGAKWEGQISSNQPYA
jgi:vacuolar iron transporter family protein